MENALLLWNVCLALKHAGLVKRKMFTFAQFLSTFFAMANSSDVLQHPQGCYFEQVFKVENFRLSRI